jgi:thiol-disulfide isomerase/thioredoxin
LPRSRVSWAIGFVALVALAACHPADGHGPRVHAAKLADLPRPLPKPYDETESPAAVNANLDAAFFRASASGKRVIVDLGGNWCGWCRALAGVMALPEVKPFMDANFEVVSVDVSSVEGATDRNREVLRRFGLSNVKGVPWLIVAEPDGRVLDSGYTVTDDRHQTPQQMVDWLAKWAKKAPG